MPSTTSRAGQTETNLRKQQQGCFVSEMIWQVICTGVYAIAFSVKLLRSHYFPTTFNMQFLFSLHCLRNLTLNHTLCKTIITLFYLIHWQLQNHLQLDQQSHEELFTLSTWYTSSIVRRTYAQAVYRSRKDTLFKTKSDKFDTLFKPKSRKTYPDWPHVPIKPLKRSNPPSRDSPSTYWVSHFFHLL